MHFEGMVTEGAWTGSGYRDKKGVVIPTKGIAEEYSSGIVCFEEFSTLTSTMKQQHSLTLEPQILSALDEGLVRKRTTTRTIDYETNMTCWGGSVLPHTPIMSSNENGLSVASIASKPAGNVFTSRGWKRIRVVLTHSWHGMIKRLNLHGSYVDITPNHSLFENGELKEAGRLLVGDSVDLIESRIELADSPLDHDLFRARIQGFWCADGWKATNHCYRDKIKHAWFLGQKERRVLETFEEGLTEEFGDCSLISGPYRHDKIHRMYIHRRVGDALFSSCIDGAGFKIVPSAVLNSNDEIRRSFYDGFMLGDGHRELHGKVLRDCTGQALRNQPLLAGICLLNPAFHSIRLDSRHRNRTSDSCLWVKAASGWRRPLNEVRRVETVPYSGLVYDLETETGDFAVGFPSFIRAHNTQQGRFDLSGGLGRREFFVNWVPTPEEGNALKKAFWEGLNVTLDRSSLDHIRTAVSELIDRVENIRRVDFDSKTFTDLLGDVPHFEHRLHAHFALGYQIMSGDFTDKLYIGMDDTLRRRISEAKAWREHLLGEAEGDQIIQILVQAGGECTGNEICGRMLGFGSSVRQTRELLWRLANRARLIFWNEKEDVVTLRKSSKP